MDRTLLVGERHVLELIATGTSLREVLDALCRVIDAESTQISTVYVLDRDGRRMTFAAGPGASKEWRDATLAFPIGEPSGACEVAVRERRQVVVTDIAASPFFPEAWRDVARRIGIAAAWSTPFFSQNGEVLGTFAILSRKPAPPDAAELQLVQRATHLASIAVERHHTEEEIRESERRFAKVFYSGPNALAIVRVSDRRIMYVNDRFLSLYGYSRGEAIGRTSLELGLFAEPQHRANIWALLEKKGDVHEFDAKARSKAGTILDVLIFMIRIEILGEDCVLSASCDITERNRTAAELAQSERQLRVVLDTLPVGVAVVDASSNIVINNPASRRIWGGEPPTSGPDRYARTKGWWRDGGQPVARDGWASARALERGATTINQVIDIEAFDGTRKIIQNSAAPIRDDNDHITGAVIVIEDVSARDAAERGLHESLAQMRTLSGRLMRAQDDERRRIAQLLHETTSQDLAVLKMHLARLTRSDAVLSDDERAALAESIDIADRSMSGIRTLSYLLHPPFLDEAGLVAALRWYAEGFSGRSAIKVALDLPETVERLPQEVETALFRVVQEALMNIHHHANSSNAAIRVRIDGAALTLEVEDHGRGLPSELIAHLPANGGGLGVGIAGMRERLQQLGGTLEIESSPSGTRVRARVPLSSPR